MLLMSLTLLFNIDLCLQNILAKLGTSFIFYFIFRMFGGLN